MVESKALEVNLASYRIDVEINPEYLIWRDVMSGYYGLAEKLNTFLKELSHPYKNWQFIVVEARAYVAGVTGYDDAHLKIALMRSGSAVLELIEYIAPVGDPIPPGTHSLRSRGWTGGGAGR